MRACCASFWPSQRTSGRTAVEQLEHDRRDALEVPGARGALDAPRRAPGRARACGCPAGRGPRRAAPRQEIDAAGREQRAVASDRSRVAPVVLAGPNWSGFTNDADNDTRRQVARASHQAEVAVVDRAHGRARTRRVPGRTPATDDTAQRRHAFDSQHARPCARVARGRAVLNRTPYPTGNAATCTSPTKRSNASLRRGAQLGVATHELGRVPERQPQQVVASPAPGRRSPGRRRCRSSGSSARARSQPAEPRRDALEHDREAAARLEQLGLVRSVAPGRPRRAPAPCSRRTRARTAASARGDPSPGCRSRRCGAPRRRRARRPRA